MRRTAYKTTPPAIIRCSGNVLTEFLLSNYRVIHRPIDCPLIRHGTHRKLCLRQFFYCCMYSLPRERLPSRCLPVKGGSQFTEPLPSNDRKVHIQTYRSMGGIYEVRRWEGPKCHDIRTKFHKDWFSHSKVDGVIHRDTAWWSHKSAVLIFFQNKKK
jgi:hypothetical protein